MFSILKQGVISKSLLAATSLKATASRFSFSTSVASRVDGTKNGWSFTASNVADQTTDIGINSESAMSCNDQEQPLSFYVQTVRDDLNSPNWGAEQRKGAFDWEISA